MLGSALITLGLVAYGERLQDHWSSGQTGVSHVALKENTKQYWEAKATSDTTLRTCYGADQCDPAWFSAGSKCYTVIPIPKTWPEAIALCASSSFGGSLVQLETMSEKTALTSHLSTTYEVIFPTNEFWVGASGGKSVFVWYQTKAPLTYLDYVDGVGQGVGCLSFSKVTLQKYKVTPCTSQNLVICEKSPTNQTTTTTAPMVG